MKCKVIRGCKIDGVIHKPGDWSNRYEPTFVELDGRSPEVKAYIESGVLQVVEEDKPKVRKCKAKVEGE